MPIWFSFLFFGVFVLTIIYNAFTVWLIYHIGSKYKESAQAAGLPVSIFDMSFRNGISLFVFLLKANNSFGDQRLMNKLRVWRVFFIMAILGVLGVFAGFFYLFATTVANQST